MERSVESESESLEYDYEHMDEKGNYKRVKVTSHNYPMLTDETFGLSLIGLKKQLNRELEAVRDELATFNATHKIDYESPEGILRHSIGQICSKYVFLVGENTLVFGKRF